MANNSNAGTGRRITRSVKRRATQRISDIYDNSDKPSGPQRKRAKRTRTATTGKRGRMSEEGGTASREPCAAPTVSVGGAESPSTSPAAALPAPDVSGDNSVGDSEVVCLTNSKRKGPPSRRDCGSRRSRNKQQRKRGRPRAEDLSSAVKITRTSEEGENSSGQARDPPTASVDEVASTSTSPAAVLPAPDLSGSSSDGDSEKCPICLNTLETQEVGKPDSCDHLFCMSCLEEWSAKTNTCPIDRQVFNVILVRNYPNGEIIRIIPVRSRLRQFRYEAVSPQYTRLCELCGESNGRGDRLAYCNTCNFLYHPECVSSRRIVTLDRCRCPHCSRLCTVFHTDLNS
jgi:hypothetical protein